ncbi:MAG: hypothetical protein P8090_12680 [Gammaproteobacteria bacterium]
MNRMGLGLIFLGVQFALVTTAASAGGLMSADAVKALFSGKTAKGTNLKKHISYKVYFAPSGQLKILMQNGSTRQGTWRVRDDGNHCVIVGNGDERCQRVRDNDDGTYTKVVAVGSKEVPIVMLRDFSKGNQLGM